MPANKSNNKTLGAPAPKMSLTVKLAGKTVPKPTPNCHQVPPTQAKTTSRPYTPTASMTQHLNTYIRCLQVLDIYRTYGRGNPDANLAVQQIQGWITSLSVESLASVYKRHDSARTGFIGELFDVDRIIRDDVQSVSQQLRTSTNANIQKFINPICEGLLTPDEFNPFINRVNNVNQKFDFATRLDRGARLGELNYLVAILNSEIIVVIHLHPVGTTASPQLKAKYLFFISNKSKLYLMRHEVDYKISYPTNLNELQQFSKHMQACVPELQDVDARFLACFANVSQAMAQEYLFGVSL